MAESGEERPLRCDICGVPIKVVGEQEPHYVHMTGDLFCLTTIATVDGSSTPHIGGSPPLRGGENDATGGSDG